MSEPEWVYRQRRQRAAVVLVMAIGAIVMLVVLGSTVSGGFDLDGPARTKIDRPDPDVILAREQRQIAAQNKRKAKRRHARAERRARPKPAKKPKPAAKPAAPAARSTPAPAPAPAAPNPAAAQAPPPPRPQPQPTNGAVDPRFY